MDNENVVFNNRDDNPATASEGMDLNSAGITPPAPAPVPVTPQAAPQTQEGGEEPPPPQAAPPDESPAAGHRGILKKLILGLVILVVIIFAVFLFLPRGTSDTSGELVWWGLWEDQSVVAPLIEEFEKENPNITVEYVKQDPNQYREKLQTRIQNGTGPDVFRFHNTWTSMLTAELLPLSTDVITPDEFKKTFYPVMQNDLLQNGAIYGIPLGADSLVLYTNIELFDSAGVDPPETWEEFVSTARRLTVKEEGRINTAGAALGTFGNVTHAPDIISLLFLQQGIDIRNFPAAEVSDKEDALTFYTSFAKGDQNVWDATLDESVVMFARGNLGMYIGFSWDIFRIRTLNPEIKFETHALPQLVGRNVGLASYWAEGISSKSQSKSAAMKFVNFLARRETAEKFYTEASKTREFGEIYARADLAPSLEENTVLAPFVAELGHAQSSIFASGTFDGEGGINSLANVYLGNAVNAIVNDNSSPQTVIETLDQGVSQVFEKYGIK